MHSSAYKNPFFLHLQQLVHTTCDQRKTHTARSDGAKPAPRDTIATPENRGLLNIHISHPHQSKLSSFKYQLRPSRVPQHACSPGRVQLHKRIQHPLRVLEVPVTRRRHSRRHCPPLLPALEGKRHAVVE